MEIDISSSTPESNSTKMYVTTFLMFFQEICKYYVLKSNVLISNFKHRLSPETLSRV